jgi:glycine cleavage system pyridoxal-binding protein P
MAKTTEPVLGLAVMQVLAAEPTGEASVQRLIKRVPEYVALTDEDHQASGTRHGEEIWEQRIRNLKSHDKVSGNVIGEGYVVRVARGRYKLSDSGRLRLAHGGLV